MENPHERTIQIICGILFLPVIVLTYLLIKENFNYKTPFVFFIIIYVLLYKTFCSYYIKRKKGMEIIRSKPLIFNSQKISSFISWMIYPILVVLLYFRFSSVRLNRLRNKLLANYLKSGGNELATVRISAFCVAMLSNNSFICKYSIFFRKYELSAAVL